MTTYYGIDPGEEYKPWLWPVPKGGVIGKNVTRKDGREKASGTAVYTQDVRRPGMLYAKFLTSPYAHAKITSMDTTAAEALPGVRAVIRWDDKELVWTTWQSILFHHLSEPVSDTAQFAGQPIGAIVCADTEAIVDAALKLITIKWQELPFIIDWDAALAPGATILRPDLNSKDNVYQSNPSSVGDVEAGFKQADNIIEVTQKIGENVWAGAEPHSTVAEWTGNGEYLEIWARSQSPAGFGPRLAEVGYAPESKVKVNVPYVGAMFGGLMWYSGGGRNGMYPTDFALIPTLLAKRTGKPVKLIEDGSPFHGMGFTLGTYKYKIGFKNNGEITAFSVTSNLAGTSLEKAEACTKIPNQSLLQQLPYLNRGPTVCFKDGGPISAILNVVMTHVAGELKMDPTQVALINDGCDGEDMAWVNANVKAKQGFDPTRDSLKECLAAGKKAIDWDNKWHQPGTKILPNGNYHGIGFIWCHAWTNSGFGKPTVGLVMHVDGTASILGRHGDGGWNGESTYCQVVADELGLKYSDVDHRPFNDVGAFDTVPGGSSAGMIGTVPAMTRVARKLKKIILEYAIKEIPGFWGFPATPASFPGKTIAELDIQDGSIFEIAKPDNKVPVSKITSGFETESASPQGGTRPFFAWDTPPDASPTDPPATYYLGRQCYFQEVEVDPETGGVETKNYVISYDCGTAINPDTVLGQGYGGTYMGAIGASFTEEIFYDPPTGVKLNDNLIGYAVPVMNDCGPITENLIETHFGYGPYGAYGCGESPKAHCETIGASSVYNAIGKWIEDYPITPEKILKALGKA
jgi:CO/xanthine dehydrogenase Mo-binding subunit